MHHFMVIRETSSGVDMTHGVPQGSVSEPKLFSLYMNPLSEVMKLEQCKILPNNTVKILEPSWKLR